METLEFDSDLDWNTSMKCWAQGGSEITSPLYIGCSPRETFFWWCSKSCWISWPIASHVSTRSVAPEWPVIYLHTDESISWVFSFPHTQGLLLVGLRHITFSRLLYTWSLAPSTVGYLRTVYYSQALCSHMVIGKKLPWISNWCSSPTSDGEL